MGREGGDAARQAEAGGRGLVIPVNSPGGGRVRAHSSRAGGGMRAVREANDVSKGINKSFSKILEEILEPFITSAGLMTGSFMTIIRALLLICYLGHALSSLLPLTSSCPPPHPTHRTGESEPSYMKRIEQARYRKPSSRVIDDKMKQQQ